MPRHHFFREEGPRPITLLISADTANYDLYVAAGSPAGIVNVTLIIASGHYLYSTTGAGFALYQSAPFAAGSTITVINNGGIIGKGGAGGNGGNGPSGLGANGGGGGTAIDLKNSVTIDNTFGLIAGGGKGGKGGDSAAGHTGVSGGGGGGGGKGYGGGAGGAKGTGSGGGPDGVAGTAGSLTAPGPGGAPRSTSGGGFGDGEAINLNGNVVTWLGGNNSSQVVGAVA